MNEQRTCHHPTCNGFCRRPAKEKNKKREKINAEYRQAAKKFIKENPKCAGQLKGICTKKATEVHHAAGRVGENLMDQSTWVPLCRSCHTWVEKNPRLSRVMGLSESRLNVKEI